MCSETVIFFGGTVFEGKRSKTPPALKQLFFCCHLLSTFTPLYSPSRRENLGEGSKESNEDVGTVDEGNNESVTELWLPTGENRLNLSTLGC